jgi:RNA polymerase sigma-70 factor, ECF subfamily
MESPTSTFGLIERFKHGDEEAFALLFEKYRRRLALLIHYQLGPKLRGAIEVDDILQETFLTASQELDRFQYRSPGSFLSWLLRIAEHSVLDAARFHGRKKRQPEALLRFRSESNPQGADPVDSKTPSRLFAQEERLRRVFERLDALPDNYRQAILLGKIAGLTTEEVGKQMGCSRDAAALLLHRALKRFRELDASPSEKP